MERTVFVADTSPILVNAYPSFKTPGRQTIIVYIIIIIIIVYNLQSRQCIVIIIIIIIYYYNLPKSKIMVAVMQVM